VEAPEAVEQPEGQPLEQPEEQPIEQLEEQLEKQPVEQPVEQLVEQEIPHLQDQDHLQIMEIIIIIIYGDVKDSDAFETFSMQSRLRLRNPNNLKEAQKTILIPIG
jgi:hypothetical protein